jgi:hypothetical protein
MADSEQEQFRKEHSTGRSTSEGLNNSRQLVLLVGATFQTFIGNKLGIVDGASDGR